MLLPAETSWSLQLFFILNIPSDQISEHYLRCNMLIFTPAHWYTAIQTLWVSAVQTPQFCLKPLRYLLGGFNIFACNSNLDHQVLLNCLKPCIWQTSLWAWISNAHVPSLPYVVLLVLVWLTSDAEVFTSAKTKLDRIWRRGFLWCFFFPFLVWRCLLT